MPSNSSDTDSSQFSLSASSKSKKQRKRRLIFTGDESSDGKSRFKSREKKTRRQRDHSTRVHAHDWKVLKELQKSNNSLLSLLERADKTEKRLRIVEEEISKASTSISSSDTTPRRSRKCAREKANVPQVLRVSSIIATCKPPICPLCCSTSGTPSSASYSTTT